MEREEALRQLGPFFVNEEGSTALFHYLLSDLESLRVKLEKATDVDEIRRLQGSIRYIRSLLDLKAKFKESISGRK